MAQRYSARRTHVYATPARTPRRRAGFLRRVFVLLLVLLVCAAGVGVYWMEVYAPGLETEAASIPDRVHAQLQAQGERYVPLNLMSPDLRRAIVAVEDRRFYYHPGVDPVGTVRALIVNTLNNHIDQGGSTLEEQLAKRTIVGNDASLHEKLRTMGLAWAIDRDFPKSRVLELYLNAAYYGQGAYGPNAAARVYFGTDAAHLTLPEAAFLAALPQAPSLYGANPRSTLIMARKNTVLADMYENGYITFGQARAAQAAKLQFALPNP